MFKKNRFARIEFIVFFILSFLSVVSFAEPPPSFGYKRLDMSLQGDYFHTSRNFLGEGNKYENLKNEASYTNFLFEPQVLYGLLPQLALGMSLGYSFSGYSRTTRVDEKNSGLTHVKAMGLYKIYLKPFLLQPKLELTIPIYTVDDRSKKPFLGEGALEVEAGSFVQGMFLNHKLYGYLGVNYRDGGRSHLLSWSMGFSSKKYMLHYGLELNGYRSLTDDKHVGTRVREAVTESSGAGSRRFYSVNPGLTNIEAHVGIDIRKNIAFKLAYSLGVEGKNTAAGKAILMSILWDYDFSNQHSHKKTQEQESDRQKNFKYEGSDEKLEKFFDEKDS